MNLLENNICVLLMTKNSTFLFFHMYALNTKKKKIYKFKYNQIIDVE